MSDLFTPITIGALKLRNRVILAPLTRSRATGEDGRTPNALMAEYYVQRSSAGMILTEATSVTPMGVGYANTPGIWSEAHVNGWKAITEAVHAKGGLILLQLWHVGRVSHPTFLNGELPVAPSAIACSGHVSLLRPKVEYPVPRELKTSEIPGIIEAYRKGAENAKRAGFDGVELHGANGYLLDQFLQDVSNQRSDEYGGSLPNRAKVMIAAVDAAISVWGADRVGLHLAPRGDSHAMGDSNREAAFSYVADEMGKRKIAFLCAREYVAPDSLGPKLKRIFKGIYIGNEKFTRDSAEAALKRGDIDAVAFGKDFLANPDLPKRLEMRAPLNSPIPETFYAPGSSGYTDYPFMTA